MSLLATEQILSFPNDKPTVWRRNITTEELIKWYKTESVVPAVDTRRAYTCIRSDRIARSAIIITRIEKNRLTFFSFFFLIFFIISLLLARDIDTSENDITGIVEHVAFYYKLSRSRRVSSHSFHLMQDVARDLHSVR